ncbi:hypothetical protein OG342_02280 [Streptomyces bobili]|nr:hypothetical protein [Streptomyces bobili]MCX5521703.1 hypothetical protein [Streptomyces bobili]
MRGLHTVADVTYLTFTPDEDLAARVAAAVDELAGRTAEAAVSA